MKYASVAVWCGLLSLVIGGCATPTPPVQPPYTVYRSPNLMVAPPRRVLLMPVVNLTYDDGFAKQWYQILAGELRASKQFEVVVADPRVPCVQQCLALVQRGQYAEREMMAVRDHFRVEGLLFVTQADYYPYTPPRIAAAVNLVDANTGETIAAIDGTWNADDPCVQKLIQQYGRHAVTAKRLNNSELVTLAPTYFGRFVASELADSLCKLIQIPAAPPASTHLHGTDLAGQPSPSSQQPSPEVVPTPAPVTEDAAKPPETFGDSVPPAVTRPTAQRQRGFGRARYR